MTVEAKICGLSTPETLDAAVEAGAGFVGFVTFPRSPRHIESLDLLKALGLYQRACDGGNASGCNNLGLMNMKGLGTPANPAAARSQFERGCAGFGFAFHLSLLLAARCGWRCC